MSNILKGLLKEGAYEEGFNDGMNGHSNPRASSIYGPSVEKYRQGFRDGEKKAEEEKDQRRKDYEEKIAPYLDIPTDELKDRLEFAIERTKEIREIYNKLRGSSYDFDPKRHTPKNDEELKDEFKTLRKEIEAINDVLDQRRRKGVDEAYGSGTNPPMPTKEVYMIVNTETNKPVVHYDDLEQAKRDTIALNRKAGQKIYSIEKKTMPVSQFRESTEEDKQKYVQAAKDVLKGADFDHLVRIRRLDRETLRKHVDYAWDKVNKGEYKLNRPNLDEQGVAEAKDHKKIAMVADRIMSRIMMVYPDIIRNYGHEVVGDAILNVAEVNQDSVLTPDNVTQLVRQVKQMLDTNLKNLDEQKCPHCGGPMFEETLMMEKKDACYYKVKSRYKVWPSAYASGALVKCRKKGAKNWGNKSKNESVAEGQLNEYLVIEGEPFSAVLNLNVFMDTSPDGQVGMDHDPQWRQLMAKYQPVAKQLKQQIRALNKYKLSANEVDAIESIWYDGSDAYDDMEVDYLASLFDQQIQLVKQMIAARLRKQGVAEETIHVGYRNSSGDWIKTTTHDNYRDAKAAMERLVKAGKKGVQHRYDNKGNIDPGAMMTARPDSGVAEGIGQDMAKLGGIAALGIGAGLAGNYYDQQQPRVEVGGQKAYLVKNPGWGTVPDNAMTLQGKDGKTYTVWAKKGKGSTQYYATPADNVKEGVAEGLADLDPTTKLAIKVIQQNKRRNEPLAYIQAVKHLKKQGWTSQEIKNIESNSSPDADLSNWTFEGQGVAEGSVWSNADQKMKHHSEFPHTHTAANDIRSSMSGKVIVTKGARLSALGNDNYLNLDTGVQPIKLDPAGVVKQGVAEEQLDELKCWPGYTRVRGVPAGAPGSCKKKTNEEELDENLRKWFKEKWVRFGPDGKIRGACARGSESEGKPKCLPQSKAHSLGKKGRKYAASKKRREDPNPNRSGPAKNVATKKKTSEGIDDDSKIYILTVDGVEIERLKNLKLAQELLNILRFQMPENKIKLEIKEKNNSVKEATSNPMRMQDYLDKAEELHNRMMDASRKNDTEEFERLKKERNELDKMARQGMVPEGQIYSGGNKPAGLRWYKPRSVPNQNELSKESAIMKGLQLEGNDEEHYTGGGLGTPYPSTYEQETLPYRTKGQRRTQAIAFEDEQLDEKWSEKYKRSIDCSNPKGFSQKAHCQGRKKK